MYRMGLVCNFEFWQLVDGHVSCLWVEKCVSCDQIGETGGAFIEIWHLEAIDIQVVVDMRL